METTSRGCGAQRNGSQFKLKDSQRLRASVCLNSFEGPHYDCHKSTADISLVLTLAPTVASSKLNQFKNPLVTGPDQPPIGVKRAHTAPLFQDNPVEDAKSSHKAGQNVASLRKMLVNIVGGAMTRLKKNTQNQSKKLVARQSSRIYPSN